MTDDLAREVGLVSRGNTSIDTSLSLSLVQEEKICSASDACEAITVVPDCHLLPFPSARFGQGQDEGDRAHCQQTRLAASRSDHVTIPSRER